VNIRTICIYLVVVLGPSSILGQTSSNLAIKKAVQFLKKKSGHIDPMMIATLQHLNKQFAVDIDIRAQRAEILKNPVGHQKVFIRFLDEKRIASEKELKQVTGIDYMTALSLYCDVYELPVDYFTLVNGMAKKGGYYLTHATLSMALIHERKCKYNETARLRELAFEIPRLEKLILAEPAHSDLKTEAMLMLFLVQRKDLVKPEWLSQLIAAQQSDGSFGDDHYTVLALWTLLESLRK